MATLIPKPEVTLMTYRVYLEDEFGQEITTLVECDMVELFKDSAGLAFYKDMKIAAAFSPGNWKSMVLVEDDKREVKDERA